MGPITIDMLQAEYDALVAANQDIIIHMEYMRGQVILTEEQIHQGVQISQEEYNEVLEEWTSAVAIVDNVLNEARTRLEEMSNV